MYTHQVNFSKRFVDGILKGRLYHDYLRFCDKKTAQDFKKKCESDFVFAPSAGNASYTVEDVTISELE